MQIVHTVAEVRAWRTAAPRVELGLVPTMGALHAGHLSLVARARAANRLVAVSLFVNPTQFGPHEDLAQYPRSFEGDRALLEAAGVDLLFAPEPAVMYPPGFATVIDVGPVAARLDGASRPGHFTGVATVVTKLFGIVAPTRAYFGQKDAAQVAVLRTLVRDLNLPVEVVVCPIVRETDGLALSSRNRYLLPHQREQAPVLSRALMAAENMTAHGIADAATLLEAAGAVLRSEPGFRQDYLALVDPENLEATPELLSGRETLLAVAGSIGTTRLIDNVLLRRVPVKSV